MSVDEVVAAIESMSEKEREELLMRLAVMDELLEDLGDIMDVIRSKHEEATPFDEFITELRAEGRDV